MIVHRFVRVPTFTTNLTHFVVVLAIVYVVATFANLIYFIKIFRQCKLVDYVESVGATAIYTHNLKTFRKRSLLFILLLSPATAFWPMIYAIAIPQYLIFTIMQIQLRGEWQNIGMTAKQVYGPMALAFAGSLLLGRLIGWGFVNLAML